jgi:DNA repair ATPase RecN
MKKSIWSVFLIFIGVGAYSQSEEAEQLLLDLQKLAQLKSILEDLKKGYTILESGYSTIRNISQGNFSLHELFLNSLLEVSPTVRNYKRIADIISLQLRIVKECQTAFKQFRGSELFDDNELNYITSVYSNLSGQSLKNLDALASVTTSGQLRMSDDERLSEIDGIWKNISDQFSFLKDFNGKTRVLALQRAKEKRDIESMKALVSGQK